MSDPERGSDSDSEPSSVEFGDLTLERNTDRQRDMSKHHSFTTSESDLSDSCLESVPSAGKHWSNYIHYVKYIRVLTYNIICHY